MKSYSCINFEANIYFFVLTTLSIIDPNTIELHDDIMNNSSERMQNDAIAAQYQLVFWQLAGGTARSHEES
jgi:hypothetical protein